jgi:membrane associated rhomboid family serine protease
MGHLRFLAFYLLCGVAASAAHIVFSPASRIPAVGASGAISGIMGAYILLYPKVKVHTWIPPSGDLRALVVVFHQKDPPAGGGECHGHGRSPAC